MTNGSDMAAFEARLKQVYSKLKNTEVNHFELFGLPKTATFRDIQAAYGKYSQAFPRDKIKMVADPETQKMGIFILERINRAYEVLSDYDKKADYEKKGFRDIDPDAGKDEDLEELAKVIYKKGKNLHAQKQFDKAIIAMKEAIKLDPEKPSYYLLLGLSQSQFPHLKMEAEKNLRKASEMESWNAEPVVGLGMLFYSEKLYKRAETYFRKALELESGHALARAKLNEIAQPEETLMDKVHDQLSKFLPTVFGKKK